MEADESECADFEWSDLIGKRVLVGITFQDRRGIVLDREQVHGCIEVANPLEGIVVGLEGMRVGEKYTLPPDLSAFQLAQPGEYRLRVTGERVTNPELLATWTVTQPDA